MFTGLVEAVGKLERTFARQSNRVLEITAADWLLNGLKKGDSVAVNGCCLTVTRVEAGWFEVEVVSTTLQRTTLGRLSPGCPLNLERALRADSRLGGHFVLGHVDEVGVVQRVVQRAAQRVITIGVGEVSSLLPKGSVCVDGVSLTVADVAGDRFSVNIVPYTWENTTLRHLRYGARVNVEFDVLVKAVVEYLRRIGQK